MIWSSTGGGPAGQFPTGKCGGGVALLVTGGAGYIGSHIVRVLADRVSLVVDDLSTGDPKRVSDLPLLEIDLSAADTAGTLARAMRDHAVDTVIHVAARKRVDESVARPTWYFTQNVGSFANVLDAMRQASVSKLVLSSSAAVYGNPADSNARLTEDSPCHPSNPYGETKLVCEWLCRDAERAWGLQWLALRYFNVGGAGWVDLADTAKMNLIPLVIDAVVNNRRPIVFGTDFPTPDGTAVRDYVHVMDVATAHAAAVAALSDRVAIDRRVLNVGTGEGHSVLDVLRRVSIVTGGSSEPELRPRRAGDPASAVADPSLAASILGWSARRSLAEIVESTWSLRAAEPTPSPS
jgi:UDP-glucose 4-epimerase